MQHLQEIAGLLSSPQRIAIVTHQRPDGDAMGSSLALYHYLTRKGHQPKVVTPTDYPDFLKWLPGDQDVLVGPEDPERARWTFDGADIIFCLDFNALHRINEFEPMVADSPGKKVLIDHHLDPGDFDDFRFWDDTASSTAEMIYRLIVGLGDRELIDLATAQCLYTGLMTDTGSFRFSSTTPAVHQMAAHLLEVGVDMTEVHDQIFATSTVDRLRFVGHCLQERLTLLPELRTAYIMVPKEVFKEYNVKTGDTEGLVNYALGIKDVSLGILLTVKDNLVKLSFRSRGSVNSAELASHFEGGGHFYASGGRSTDSLEATEKKLLDLLEANKEMLLADTVAQP